MSKAKRSEKFFTLAFLVLAILVLIGCLPFRFKTLNNIAEAVLLSAGADSVWVESVSVTLFNGISVSGLKTVKRLNSREEYRISIERADISGNLLLLALWALGKPELLNFERDIFMEVYEKPFSVVSDGVALMTIARPLKNVMVSGADIEFFERKKSAMSVLDASIKIDKSNNAIRGKVNVFQTTIPALASVQDFSAKVEADEECISLIGGSGTVFGGKLSANASIDLKNASVLDGKITIKQLDIEQFCLQTKFSTGRMSGKVNVSAVLEEGSSVLALDSVKAKGNITVKNLTVINVPLQNTPIVNFVSPELKTLRFSEVKGNFSLDSARLSFDEILGSGNLMNFRSSGWVGLDGSLNQDFDGEFSEVFASTLSGLVRSSLDQTDSGGRRFNCKISGTFQEPRVELGGGVIGKAAGSAVSNAARGLRNLFR